MGSAAPFLALLLVVWSELHNSLSDFFSMVPPTLSSGALQILHYHKSECYQLELIWAVLSLEPHVMSLREGAGLWHLAISA